MSLGISAVGWAAIGTTAAGIYSANKSAGAARDAAGTQAAAAQAGIDAQNQRFAEVQKLLAPFVNSGTSALTQQGNLIGMNGTAAQKQAVQALQSSPAFLAQLQQGQNSILSSASATGGLRGGNVQAALAQFSPALLAQTINDQFGRLGSLSSLGQNAAAGVGNAGMQNANGVANLLQQQGAATAGGQLAQGQAAGGYANAIAGGLGQFMGGGQSLLAGFTQPNMFGTYANPSGETYNYRGTELPGMLRGGF